MNILFTGGGTGGHIVPIIALAREIRRAGEKDSVRFSYMGPKDEFAEVFFEQEGIAITTIFAGKFRRYTGLAPILLTILGVLFLTPVGVFQSFVKIFFLSPDLVFSKGGYGALPSTIAAWLLRVPIFLHESDVVPGMANRIAALFARRIFVSFKGTQYFSKKKMEVVGNPVRKELLTGNKKDAVYLFRLAGGKPLLAVLGGSQGSARLNDMLLQIIDALLHDFEIVHQTGEKNFKQVSKEAKVVISKDREKYYHPVPFLKETELRHLYAAADFIINRAGSGSIFEIAALKKPSILIPLPEAAQNHQAQNAYEYARNGAAIVLEEANLTPHFFLEKLKYLFANPKELDTMRAAAGRFARPKAASGMARTIVDYLSK